jgi:hypothetical protein
VVVVVVPGLARQTDIPTENGHSIFFVKNTSYDDNDNDNDDGC